MAKKGNIIFFLLTAVFLASFFVSMISNYKLPILMVKGAVSIVLIILICFDYKTGSNKSAFLGHKDSVKIFSSILFIVCLIFALTLLYSLNPKFGALKFVHIIAGTLPCVFGLFYIILTINSDRLKVFIYTVILAAMSLAIPTIILEPFSFVPSYSFSIANWSHVIFARFVSILLLIILINHFYLSYRLNIYVSGIILLTLVLSTLISGHKASIIGVLVTAIILIVYKSYKYSLKNEAVYTAGIALTLSVLVMIVFYGNNESARRAATIVEPDKLITEGGVAVRLDLWEKAIEAGNENIILGTGLGGFRSEKYLGKDLLDLKYPHNLLLEIYAELGIVMSLIIIFTLIKVFIKSFKLGAEIFLLSLYFLWLSLFSKDIATNTQVWFFLILIVIDNNTIEKVKSSFRLTDKLL